MAEDDDRPRKRPDATDFDGKPGGLRESRAYDRLYNHQGEDEYTNLPENANQMELRQLELDEERRQEERESRGDSRDSHAARVQRIIDIGTFIIPQENTFAAHQQLVRGAQGAALAFDTSTYRHFDAVIAAHANRPEIFDPSHPEYATYAPLRENLAVLRNSLMGTYMTDGSFDPGDEHFAPRLENIAADLGDAIRHDNSWFGRNLFHYVDTNLLNMEGDGAAYAYRHLLKRQQQPALFASLLRDLRNLFKLSVREWELPPVEATPFSEDGLNAPPPPPPEHHAVTKDGAQHGNNGHHHARAEDHWQEFIKQERLKALEAGQHAGLV